MRFAVIALVLLTLVGCGPKPEMALYGNWEGGFSETGKSEPQVKGYLQLYATGHRFKLHLGNADQSYDVAGMWRLNERQVLLAIKDINFAGLTKQEAEERRKPYMDPAEIRTDYGHQLILNLSSDKKSLAGLPMKIAGNEGAHAFEKVALSSYR